MPRLPSNRLHQGLEQPLQKGGGFAPGCGMLEGLQSSAISYGGGLGSVGSRLLGRRHVGKSGLWFVVARPLYLGLDEICRKARDQHRDCDG